MAYRSEPFSYFKSIIITVRHHARQVRSMRFPPKKCPEQPYIRSSEFPGIPIVVEGYMTCIWIKARPGNEELIQIMDYQ